MTDGKTARIVLSKKEEIDEVKKRHPELTKQLDAFARDLRGRLRGIHEEILKLDREDQELVCTAVIHGLHRMTDEIYL